MFRWNVVCIKIETYLLGRCARVLGCAVDNFAGNGVYVEDAV